MGDKGGRCGEGGGGGGKGERGEGEKKLIVGSPGRSTE